MRKFPNGYDIGFCNLDNSVTFANEKELTDAIIAGAAPAGPWIKTVTIKILEFPE